MGLRLREPMEITPRRDLGKEPMGCRVQQNFLELMHINLGELLTNLYIKQGEENMNQSYKICKLLNWGIMGSHPKYE